MNDLSRTLLTAAKAVPMLTLAGAIHAQTAPPGYALEEVIITAQKRSENLQQTPLAISAFSADELTKQGIVDVPALVNKTPSVYGAPYPLSNMILTLYMRGQGNNDPMQITKDGSIGIYENGIYNPRPQSIIFDLADVEQVEVLRGPQGTLYGRNTTGGAMSITSRAPTGKFGLRQLISFGDRQQLRSITNIDLPEVANLSSKITIATGHDDGYVENTGSSHNFNSKQYQGARLALLWQPLDDVTVDYAYTWSDVRSTPGYLTNTELTGEPLPGVPYHSTDYKTYRPIDLPESSVKSNDHTLTVSWDVSDNLTLKSLTGVRHFVAGLHTDTAESYGYGLMLDDYIDSKQFSQEFQIIGSIGDRVDYVGGLYYYDENADHLEHGLTINGDGLGTVFPFDRLVDADAKSTAAYGQLTWTPPILADKLALTFGARFTRDKREATRNYFGVASNDKEFSRFTPTFTAAYTWSDTLSTYAKIATGYRAGGSSESSLDFNGTFGPEKLTTYELGLKADWLDRRLRTNLAAFYSDYKDIQLDVSPDPSDVTVTQTFNAGKAVIEGIEADITAALTEDFTVTLGYAWLHTDVKKVSVPGLDITADDFVIPYAPKSSVNVAADYTFYHFDEGSLSAHLDYAWKDMVYNTSGAGTAIPGRNLYSTPAYGMLNGRLTLEYQRSGAADPVRVSLWARNLANKHVPIYGSAIGSSTGGYSSPIYNYSEPFTFGLEVAFSYD